MKTFTIIPSGGSGKRINSSLPKQYVKINEKELIAYTLQIFQNCDLIDGIIIAAQKEFFDLLYSIQNKYQLNKIINIVEGGVERHNSVHKAVAALNAAHDDLIVIHDAVRPLLSTDILINTINAAKEAACAVAAIKVKDTLAEGTNEIISYLDRSSVYYIQTPQVFRYDVISEALHKAEEDKFIGTDETMLAQRLGYNVKIVEGSSFNFKITTNDDLRLFEQISKKID